MANFVFLIATLPIVLYCVWSDLRYMKLFNWANIALFMVFLILGAIMLPFPEYGIRLAQAAIVLVITFGLSSLGVMGGGDAKLFAAIAPFVARQDATQFLLMLCVLALVSVFVLSVMKRIPPIKRMFSEFKSFTEKRNFPYGVPLALTLTFYLALKVSAGA